MKNNNYQKIIVVIMTLGGIIFIAMVLIFLFFPALKDVNTLSDEVLNAQTELEAQYTNRKNLLESIQKVSRIRETTDALKSQFLTPGDELLFIKSIEEISSSHAVESAITINEARVKKGAPVGDASFEVGFSGTYPNVLSAIRSMERLPNITLINSTSIHAGNIVPESQTIISAKVQGILIFTPDGL